MSDNHSDESAVKQPEYDRRRSTIEKFLMLLIVGNGAATLGFLGIFGIVLQSGIDADVMQMGEDHWPSSGALGVFFLGFVIAALGIAALNLGKFVTGTELPAGLFFLIGMAISIIVSTALFYFGTTIAEDTIKSLVAVMPITPQ